MKNVQIILPSAKDCMKELESVNNLILEGTLDFNSLINITRRIKKVGMLDLLNAEIPDTLPFVDITRHWDINSIYLPKNINRLYWYESVVFSSYPRPLYINEIESLEAIAIHPDNSMYKSENGVLFDKTMSKLLMYPRNKSCDKFIIPESVTKIGEYAFMGSNSTNTIVIPASVSKIGRNAFFMFDGKIVNLSHVYIEQNEFM